MTGKRFTFLTDPEDFKVFFQSPNVDFQQAVQQAVQKTGIANNCTINKKHLIEYYVQLQTFKSFHNYFLQEAYQKLRFGIITLSSMIQSNIN